MFLPLFPPRPSQLEPSPYSLSDKALRRPAQMGVPPFFFVQLNGYDDLTLFFGRTSDYGFRKVFFFLFLEVFVPLFFPDSSSLFHSAVPSQDSFSSLVASCFLFNTITAFLSDCILVSSCPIDTLFFFRLLASVEQSLRISGVRSVFLFLHPPRSYFPLPNRGTRPFVGKPAFPFPLRVYPLNFQNSRTYLSRA